MSAPDQLSGSRTAGVGKLSVQLDLPYCALSGLPEQMVSEFRYLARYNKDTNNDFLKILSYFASHLVAENVI